MLFFPCSVEIFIEQQIPQKMEFVKEVDLKSVALNNLEFIVSKTPMSAFQGQL